MSEHAILAPSAAPMWVNCGGSVPLQAQQPPQADTPENLEGNAAHWMAATLLKQMVQFGQATPYKEGTTCPNGVVITAEMLQAVDEFVDDVVEVAGQYLPQIHIEERVDCFTIHPDDWGTPDVWLSIVLPGGKSFLIVWDFKYGHRFVDAFENWQCLNYVAGILELPEIADDPSISIRIIQPRSFDPMGPVRSWTTRRAALAPYFDKLRAAALNARGNDPACLPGDWCYDCTAARACRTLQRNGYAAMDIAAQAVTQDMTPEALAIELRMMTRARNVLEARTNALEEQALSILKGNGKVPDYEIEQGFGRETWIRPPEEVFALGDMMAVNLRKPPTPITPAQARKAGMTKELVAGYAAQPIGKLKLKPVNTNQSRRVFQK